MNQENTKLTTVKILKDVYSSFKKVSFNSDVTLQKLVNRTVERYVSDADFRNEMNEYVKLQISFKISYGKEKNIVTFRRFKNGEWYRYSFKRIGTWYSSQIRLVSSRCSN